MTTSVSVGTLTGQSLGPFSFESPVVCIAELRACIQQAQPQQEFKLLLADRLLEETEELMGPEVKVTAVFEKDYAEIEIDSFEELNLREDILRGIYSYGFEKPSELQRHAVLPMLDGRNLIVQAQSGTGKTASYVVGALQLLDTATAGTQVLVLAPTRELACPIQKVALAIGEYSRVTSHACIGGTSVRADIDALSQHPQFVTGTPGRILDMVGKRHLRLDALKLFVLDEMDEMMSRGFKGLILETMQCFPPELQLAVFGATLPDDALAEMKRFLHNPVRLKSKNKTQLTLEGVRQFYVAIESEECKKDVLIEILSMFPPTKPTVIYCNTRRKCDFLSVHLTQQGIAHAVLHADLDQRERDLLMSSFTGEAQGGVCVLISTDLLGSGGLSTFPVVINYDLPQNMENYMRRVGRTTPFYSKGVAICCVTNSDVRTLRDISKFYATAIEELPEDFLDLITTDLD